MTHQEKKTLVQGLEILHNHISESGYHELLVPAWSLLQTAKGCKCGKPLWEGQ